MSRKQFCCGAGAVATQLVFGYESPICDETSHQWRCALLDNPDFKLDFDLSAYDVAAYQDDVARIGLENTWERICKWLLANGETNYCVKKFADVVCTEDVREKLVMLPINQISLWARTEGEIRPAGRNPYKVWTPLALTRFLSNSGASIRNGVVEMPVSQLAAARPRGGRGISRYKINSLFFIRSECVTIEGGTARFQIRSVRQLNPTIAAKMFFDNLSFDEVKTHYFG